MDACSLNFVNKYKLTTSRTKVMLSHLLTTTAGLCHRCSDWHLYGQARPSATGGFYRTFCGIPQEIVIDPALALLLSHYWAY